MVIYACERAEKFFIYIVAYSLTGPLTQNINESRVQNTLKSSIIVVTYVREVEHANAI